MKHLAVFLLAVTLQWVDNSDNENGFMIEKTISGNCTDGFELFAYVGIGVETMTDNLGAPGNCYRVAAFNEFGLSGYSNTAQVPKPKPCKGKNCR